MHLAEYTLMMGKMQTNNHEELPAPDLRNELRRRPRSTHCNAGITLDSISRRLSQESSGSVPPISGCSSTLAFGPSARARAIS